MGIGQGFFWRLGQADREGKEETETRNMKGKP
jgi:hypothetical protein